MVPKIFDVDQSTTGKWVGVIEDEAGTAVSSAVINTATLTLYDTATDTILNNRTAQNVKNTNQVVIDTSGNITWSWLPADMTMTSTTKQKELHTALFTIVFNGSADKILHEVSFRVHRVRQTA